MRVLALIYSHRVSGFRKPQLNLTPTRKEVQILTGEPRPVDRPSSTVNRPSQPAPTESSLLSVGRPFQCHGRPPGRPGYVCTCHAHWSTGRSIGLHHGRPGPVRACFYAVLAPFDFRSLRYLLLSPLSLQFSTSVKIFQI